MFLYKKFEGIDMEKIAIHITGDIVLSENPGKAMKKWRELFNIPQIEVARYLGVTPSVVSDYEVGRRRNPGVGMIKKYVHALIEIDKEKGGHTLKALRRILDTPPSIKAILSIKEYENPITIEEFARTIDAKIAYGENLGNIIYGHTVVDSIKAILEMDGQDFLNLYGWTTERALVFTNVSSGRSPMVAIRVSNMKPRVVVFQGVQEIDALAIKLAEVENIPLLITKLDIRELLKRLSDIK
ncbi:transcriptional regulator, XRE family [Methanotorris formicicus Mc-S-70]|uniref:Transcriptional regulator, XRE family n=2 Tax=Methanotorris formicicus TaxID=213185 RepID=H1KWP0_9EURY|nr:transcriptional regulator, XRE family [Methanotorris formicicus Mc-S-70]